MKKLNIFVVIIFLLISNLVLIDQVKASHMMGSDITWTCMGKDTFLVKLTIYRDCNGIVMSIGGVSTIVFKCKSTSAAVASYAPPIPNPTDITPTCGASCTRCQSSACSFPFGIEQYFYTAIAVLSSAGTCCEILISYEMAARNNVITNIANPGSTDLYVEATLNRCLTPCAPSPQFTNPPIAVICVGQDYTFNNGASMPSGSPNDSLSYSWTPPLGGYNSPVTWSPTFDYWKPISFYGFPSVNLPFPRGFHLDSLTGDIQFRPMKVEITVMAIKVSQWRNGVKIQETRRDLQIIVMNCPTNHPPTLGPSVYYKEVCAGSTVSFTINTNDIDPTDTVTISWNHAIPGASWTDNNGKVQHPTGTFSWTPGDAQASNIPYTFTVTAKDNACPVSGSYTHAYQVLVKPIPDAAITIVDSGCGHFYYTARATKGTSPTFLWTGGNFLFSPLTGPATKHFFPSAGKYPWSMTITAQMCSRTLRDTTKVDTVLYIYPINKMDLCKGSVVTITPKYKNNKGKVKFTWSTAKTDTSKSKTLTVTKDTNVWVQLTDTIKCWQRDTVFIWAHSKPTVNAGVDERICAYSGTSTTATYSFDRAAKKTITWTKFPSATILGTRDTLAISDSGQYICQVKDTLGCFNYDTMKVVVSPQVIASSLGNTVCLGDKVDLEADPTGSKTGNVVYKWYDPTGKLIGTGIKITIKPIITTVFTLKVSETIAGVLCKDSVPVTIKVNPLPLIKLSVPPQRCVNGTILSLDNYVTVDGSFKPGGTWTSPSPGLYTADKFDPAMSGPGTFKIKYDYTSPVTLCHNADSTNVIVNPLPKVNAGLDDSICTGGLKYLLKGGPIAPPGIWRGTGVGIGAGGYVFDPATSGLIDGGVYPLIYKYTDMKGCINEDTMMMSVFKTPVVDAGMDKDVCIDAGLISLVGNPFGGTWTGAGISGDQFNPTDSGVGTFKLTYTYTNVICTTKDVMNMTVHPLPVLTVTTADGKSQYCSNNGLINLVGTPAGGTWSGLGVTGSTFDPSICTLIETVYNLTYTYKDKWGCISSLVLKVKIRPAPSVLIDRTSNKLCFGNPYTINATFDHADGVLWWKDPSSDGTIIGAANNTSIGYNPGDTDLINLSFILHIKTTHPDNVCQPAFDSIKVPMSAMPKANFEATPREGCVPLTVDFSDLSTITIGKIAVWQWDFGDGQTSSSQNPQHIYTQVGVYTIKLRVISDAGCEDNLTKDQYISSRIVPDVAFIPKPEVALVSVPTIKFNNQTLNESPGIKWYWNFDDWKNPSTGNSTQRDPEYKYSDTGKYMVRLIAVNEFGCTDSASRLIVIMPDVIAYIPTAIRIGGINNVFKVVVDGIIDFNLQVYSRWGQLLYESTDKTKGWNGTYLNSDQVVPLGVYVYILKVKGLDGVDYKYSGTVTVLK